ncbi:tripartite tricarboxylate transporter substrate binding protein [uncultured Pseudacidovorax sp.]|uniref:Bug family tripartite tricarboxylate transporter substrate binding protein n=1 Tax=uncultured Pseudacidovorax sp. TaxID=679313 RepID=UPI0025D0788D|nr:tripartite tricarboxylate transporter substrate binding protein [uncultured Pseudacidovorax sp.]
MSPMSIFRALLLFGAWLIAGLSVHAQTTRLVVPYPAGGATDSYARQLADELTKRGLQTIVENRPGASGMIAADYVARSKPDGLTLLVGSNSTLVNNAVLFAKMSYDPFKDFVPVAHFGYQPQVLIARANAPFGTIGEYVTYAKANPGKINRASVGSGSITNLCLALLDRAAGIQTTHVPYTGEAPMIQAMLGEQVDVYMGSIAQALPYIQSGKLRALAVFDQVRLDQFPNVPTLKESGYDIDALAWFGFVASAGTPPATVNRLNRLINEVLVTDTFSAKALQLGWIRRTGSADEFGRFIAKENDLWAPLIREMGLAKSM